ncbi:MAG: MFS transporter [Candidatus Hydrogenedentes bacterium]|nr:MFS transporter [Candidatus Hydrogenedentota bacterium]
MCQQQQEVDTWRQKAAQASIPKVAFQEAASFDEQEDGLRRTVADHNMRQGIIHGAFFNMATAFADPYAVIPLFVAGFTESRALIGLVVSLITAVTVAPQISVARRIRRRPDCARPFMLAGIWTRCGAWGLIAAGTLLLPMQSRWILVVFVLLMCVYSFSGGVAGLPFKQVISQTIPPERRSTLFGWRLVTGGLFAVLAGLIVKYVLACEALAYPRNYGVLFALSFVTLAVAYAAMSCFKFSPESVQIAQRELPRLNDELRHIRWHYPVLQRLIIVRLLSGGVQLVLPFLTLYATRDVGIPLASVGLYIAAQKGGVILSNLAWMPLGNQLGTRAVILSGLGSAVLGLSVILWSSSPFGIGLAFALAGAGISAMSIGFSGYILELGTREIQPLLFALEGTFLMPLYFMPLFGGWLADGFGYRTVVWVGGALLLGALIFAFTLCEPRRGDPSCGSRIVNPGN